MDYKNIWERCCEYRIQQKPEEFVDLLKYLEENLKCRKNCLEIGCNDGGASVGFSYLFENVIAVDKEGHPFEWRRIANERRNVRFVRADSHSREFLSKLLASKIKFDFIMIDGDHSTEGTWKDFKVARRLLANDGIIAFHDIKDTPFHRGFGCHVTAAWHRALEDNHFVSREIICNGRTDYSYRQSEAVTQGMPHYTHWGGIGVMKLKSKLNLKNTTLFVLDCVDIDRALKAIKICMSYADFGHVRLLTSQKVPQKYMNIPAEIISIQPVKSKREYSEFMLKEAYKYIEDEYCLVAQWDGYILSPDAWTDEFFDYDYIGAPWWFYAEKNVGNGGFSLRSRRLMEYVAKNTPGGIDVNEDIYICMDMHDNLVENGFKFAPYRLAEKFSIENGRWNLQFGFHDKRITDISEIKNDYTTTAVCFGDMGDVIYAIPAMKMLKVERIILDPRTNVGDGWNYKMEDPECRMMKLLLEKQGFEVKTDMYWKFYDVDYKMDEWRYKGMDYTKTHISELIAKGQGIKADLTRKYIYAEPIYSHDIVISRSSRYHNKNFDWDYLLVNSTATIGFMGLRQEYENFMRDTNLTNVEYLPIVNMYQAAQIIAGSKVFIGNQSVFFAIAEGLKCNRILEVCEEYDNCQPQTNNGIPVKMKRDVLLAAIMLSKWTVRSCDKESSCGGE